MIVEILVHQPFRRSLYPWVRICDVLAFQAHNFEFDSVRLN
jgi:hypothetical protein